MRPLLLAAALCAPASAAPTPPPAPAPAASTATAAGAPAASTQTIASLYTGDRVRDPFMPGSSGAPSAARRPFNPNEPPAPVDIHNLQLRGILKGSGAASDFALFATDTGGTLLLRGGRLYDDRRRMIKGITGRILPKQKTVQLRTAEKDAQVYRLGETEEGKEQRP